jgi:hypothetical protein
LQIHFKSLKTEREVEKMAGNIISAIQECAIETAGKQTSHRKEKLKSRTKELLKKRREITGKD